uniref:Ig-like domain-containing protein n=1 Tax=Strix occidentalis caurina TaxID=311401 RepID=A0A8D0FMK8_STROC
MEAPPPSPWSWGEVGPSQSSLDHGSSSHVFMDPWGEVGPSGDPSDHGGSSHLSMSHGGRWDLLIGPWRFLHLLHDHGVRWDLLKGHWAMEAPPTSPWSWGEVGPSHWTVEAPPTRTNVSSVDWLEGKTFTCQVKHLASGTIMQDHARFCSDTPPHPIFSPGQDTPSANRIVLYVLPPTLVDLYINHEPKLRCLATNLPSDSDLQVSWSKETPGGLQPDLLDLREQFNGTFTATSTVAISSQQWEAGERFTCTVHHRDLPTPLHRSISRSTGKPSPPHVYLFAPHPDEMSQDTLTLTCLVYGFYPVDVQVQWLKNHQNVPEEDYVTTPPLKDGPKGSTFFVVSKMAVAKADWERGGPFVCMVLHEGLSMKFTQRQVQRSPGN